MRGEALRVVQEQSRAARFWVRTRGAHAPGAPGRAATHKPCLGATALQGSATLSMAYAGALFADACLRGLNGEPGVEEFTFVESSVVAGLPYFSSKVKLGPNGARLTWHALAASRARQHTSLRRGICSIQLRCGCSWNALVRTVHAHALCHPQL